MLYRIGHYRTLQVLLEHGFEPNERFEGIAGRGDEIKSLSEYFGFTPLQILVVAAKEAREIDLKKQEAGDDDFDTMRTVRHIMEVIQSSAEVLMMNGARLNVPPPTPTRLDRETPPVCYSLKDAINGRSLSSLPPVDRNGLKLIDGDHVVLTLLGGADRVKSYQKSYASMANTVESTGALKIQKGLSSALDSDAPGGSDACSCAICWSEFGMISNRKQFCKVTCRYVCNDCSTKRLVDNGSEYRISDGQFLLGKVEAGKATTNTRAKKEEASRSRRLREAQARSSIIKSKSSGKLKDPAENVAATISSLGQTRDAVVERGDKLQSLADKSEALNNASLDFAQMAKQLNQQQSSFW